MEGDIKNMSFAFEPGGKAAELAMVFKEKDLVSTVGKPICGGESSKT